MNPKCKCSTPAEICAYCATRDWLARQLAYLTRQNSDLQRQLEELTPGDDDG